LKGHRKLHVKVNKAKGRKVSSTRWLQRQLNDPYVNSARSEGYRSRSAFKLLQINEKYKCIKPGMNVIDLGSAPGGWAQVLAKLTNATQLYQNLPQGQVIAIDLNPMDPINGVDFHQKNAFDLEEGEFFNSLATSETDGILSDMASPATGHRKTDHIRIVALCELAFDLASNVLKSGGFFVAKVLEGGADHRLQRDLKQSFSHVHTFKPDATRKDSSEKYIVCLGFEN